jgi:acyl carrier protein phosphodiesterase
LESLRAAPPFVGGQPRFVFPAGVGRALALHAWASVFPFPTREEDENARNPFAAALQAIPAGSPLLGYDRFLVTFDAAKQSAESLSKFVTKCGYQVKETKVV